MTAAADTHEPVAQLQAVGDLELRDDPGKRIAADCGRLGQVSERETLPVVDVRIIATIGPVRIQCDGGHGDEQVHVPHRFAEHQVCYLVDRYGLSGAIPGPVEEPAVGPAEFGSAQSRPASTA